MRIRFLQEIAGRSIGAEEDEPCEWLVRRWKEVGAVEVLDQPPAPAPRATVRRGRRGEGEKDA